MKLLIVTPIFPPEIGGPATYVHELCERLHSKHYIDVVTFGNTAQKVKGVSIKNVKLKNGPFGRQFNLLKAILNKSKDVDLIYSQGPFVVGLMSYVVSRIRRKPLAIKFVGDLVWETAFGNGKTTKFLDDFLRKPNAGLWAKLKIKVQGFIFRRANTVIIPSEFLKDIIVKHYGVKPEKAQVVYNSTELPKNIPSKSHSKTKHMVAIGRLVKWKHMDGVIKALSLLKDKTVQLSIIGSGPEQDDLVAMATSLKVEDRVHFLGRQPYNDTLKTLKNADLFVLNSSYEGLPHTVIEAMLLNVPVLATNIPGTTEIAIHNKTAYLAKPKNPQDLSRKMTQALGDTAQTERYVKNAHALVAKQFSWDHNLAELEKAWKNVVSPLK
jgi:glycosyltransferase involved in cell wall biosynthesis